MINSKKVWSAIGLSVLAAAVIAGCSDQSGPSDSSAPSAAPAASSQSGDSKPAERASISQSIYDRGNVAPEEGTIEKNRWTKWLNENGPANVSFVAIPRWEPIPKFNTLFASGTAPDLIFDFDTNYRNELYTQKQLMPIGDLIEKYSVEYKAFLEKYPVLRKEGTKPDGKLYEFGRINTVQPNHVLFIRSDWLKKLGLEVPKTVEELFNVAKAFTANDPDGNKKNDTYGYSLSNITGQITDAMFGNVIWIIQDGKWVRDWDRVKAANEFKKRVYDAGLVDKDYLADKNGEKATQDFITGKLGIYGANGGSIGLGLSMFESLRKNNPDAQITPIELPASEFGQFSPVLGNPVQMTAAINASAKNPAAVIQYVDFLVKESTQKVLNYGIEGEHWKTGDNGCPVIISKEKNKIEKDYLTDFQMLRSAVTFGDCSKFESQLDLSNPLQKEFQEIIHQAEKAYLDPSRPMPQITHIEHMPSIPQELQLILTNTDQPIADMFNKAVVSGKSYTVDQAIADAKSLWTKAGGKQVEDWYAKWYQENKDKAFFTKDIYEVAKKG
ncbi:extracellular solute-binding protein [Paenibacillus sp. YN15]|uniref:extracellular solute-binding protein n=1 Tax=Paenibacillus sp. YN15 TaxID=1742774 RepID=UPI000DCDB9E7|nr:extracellular solute-binding protein [Paenibacillus sp. YN15]RAU96128.1 ABC transporter substrate-binding protein [Paenibacillus sp. YN15]